MSQHPWRTSHCPVRLPSQTSGWATVRPDAESPPRPMKGGQVENTTLQHFLERKALGIPESTSSQVSITPGRPPVPITMLGASEGVSSPYLHAMPATVPRIPLPHLSTWDFQWQYQLEHSRNFSFITDPLIPSPGDICSKARTCPLSSISATTLTRWSPPLASPYSQSTILEAISLKSVSHGWSQGVGRTTLSSDSRRE